MSTPRDRELSDLDRAPRVLERSAASLARPRSMPPAPCQQKRGGREMSVLHPAERFAGLRVGARARAIRGGAHDSARLASPAAASVSAAAVVVKHIL